MEKKDKYFVENLGSGVKLVCSKEHGFGTDALLLADFAGVTDSEKLCDLGCGCGIIPMTIMRHTSPIDVYAVDIQKKACLQLKKSCEISRKNINIVNSDLKDLKNKVPYGYFDVVTMNPPYKTVNTGILSRNDADIIARHETTCTFYDIALTASKLLNFGGRACFCNKPERLNDVMHIMRACNIEPKRLRFVSKNPSTAPWLFLIEGKRGSKPFMKVMPSLYVKNKDGSDSDEIIRILGPYREENL